jgi:hypothetical protein
MGFHAAYGFRLRHVELSSELQARLVPTSESSGLLFDEDALVLLHVDAGGS